jgi:hypothetical protein
MPNGRSGGFLMSTADWKELARTLPDQTVIGNIVDISSTRAVSVADVIRFIEASARPRVPVEEQHHHDYIVHISDEPQILWLSIGPKSPIFPELQRLHARYKAEHPGWNGWIAF